MSSARTPRHCAAAALPAPPRTPAPRPRPPTHPLIYLFFPPLPVSLPPYPRVGLSTGAFACAPEGPAAPFPPPRHATHTRGCCPADAEQGERGALHAPPLHTHSGGCTVHAHSPLARAHRTQEHPTHPPCAPHVHLSETQTPRTHSHTAHWWVAWHTVAPHAPLHALSEHQSATKMKNLGTHTQMDTHGSLLPHPPAHPLQTAPRLRVHPAPQCTAVPQAAGRGGQRCHAPGCSSSHGTV